MPIGCRKSFISVVKTSMQDRYSSCIFDQSVCRNHYRDHLFTFSYICDKGKLVKPKGSKLVGFTEKKLRGAMSRHAVPASL